MICADHHQLDEIGKPVIAKSGRTKRDNPAHGAQEEQAFFHQKNKTFHTFSTGRMEYDAPSKNASARNEHKPNRSLDEGDSSPENGRGGSSELCGHFHSKAKAQRSAREDRRGGGELYRRPFPRGPLSRDSAIHYW